MAATMAAHGSTLLLPPADMFWAERFARVRDPFCHAWGIATKLREMTPAQIQAAATQMFNDMPQ